MNIIVAIGKEYCQHAGVMLCSLKMNTSYVGIINLFIITDSQEDNQVYRLKRYCDKLGFNTCITSVELHNIISFPVSHHVSIATYFRILIPDLLPLWVEKAIYLDSDIIVQGDIFELWEIELNNFSLAASRDQEFHTDRKGVFNIKDNNYYFNGGVLLIDVKKWRNNDITNSLIRFLNDNPDKILWWDQDVLNGVLGNDYLLLDDYWNIQTYLVYVAKYNEVDKFNIIHYTTEKKPWLYDHPLKKEYYKYLKFTPWKYYTKTLYIKGFVSKLRHFCKVKCRNIFSSSN